MPQLAFLVGWNSLDHAVATTQFTSHRVTADNPQSASNRSGCCSPACAACCFHCFDGRAGFYLVRVSIFIALFGFSMLSWFTLGQSRFADLTAAASHPARLLVFFLSQSHSSSEHCTASSLTVFILACSFIPAHSHEARCLTALPRVHSTSPPGSFISSPTTS
jgi:hypothetical protein